MSLRTRFGGGFGRAAILATAPVILALAPSTSAGAVAAWRTLPSKPTPAAFLAAGAGARFYAAGGRTGGASGTYVNVAEKYDPASNVWSTLAPMPTARWRLAGAAFGGNVYAIGGTNNTGYLSTLERYNAATNVWSTLPSMPTPRADLAAAAAPCHETTGTCLYALGGFNGAAVLATVEEYNPATNAWTTETPMPTARGLLAAAAGAHIYAIGGNIGSPIAFNSVVLNVVEQYNPPTNTWVTLAAMPTARAALGAAAFNGNVYAAGGFANKVFLTTFERYNVASNTWSTLTPMPTGRDGLAVEAAPCPGSTAICVYAGGGFNGITDVGTLEAYG